MDDTFDRTGETEFAPGQRALWLLSRASPDSSAWQTTRAIRFRGPLRADKLRQAVDRVAARRLALRIELVERSGVPSLRLNRTGNYRLEEIDAARCDDRELRDRIELEASRPLVPGREPLFRLVLLKRAEAEAVLVATAHQLALDPDSFFAVLRELRLQYDGESEPPAASGPEAAQPQEQSRAEEEAGKAFWERKLAGALPALHLPADKPRPPSYTHRGEALTFRIPDGLVRTLRGVASQAGLGFRELLLAAFQVLLHRYANQDDLLLGVFLPPRNGVEEVGSFLNPVVVRSFLSPETAFNEVWRAAESELAEAEAFRAYPFPKLIGLLRTDRDPSFPAVFQAAYSYRGKSERDGGTDEGDGALAFELEGEEREFAKGVTYEPVPLRRQDVQYDLRLSVLDRDGEAFGRFEYYADLIGAETAERLKANYLSLLRSISMQPRERAARLNLLDEAERKLLLGGWSGASKAYPDLCIHRLFEERAALHPDKEAVVFGEERLTYRELNGRANRLARYLRSRGVVPDSPVGVYLKRTLDIPVILFAILKAGGAYVPLDPGYPRDRIAVTLEESGLKLIVTKADLASELPGDYEGDVVVYDETSEAIAGQSPDNPEGGAGPRNLAYVIYTSGTTGRPKGVAIEHRSTTRWIYAARELFDPERDFAGVLASTSICFDMSCFEFFVTLGSGGKAILAENALHLPLLPAREEVTLINTVPSAVAELVRSGGIPASVRVCNFGGEPLFGALLRQLFLRHPSIEKAYNLYGPTEDTTFSTYEIIRRGTDGDPTIGRPIPNTYAYILDAELQPVPVGVQGELYIGGDGLAREYLNRPDLTAERFLPNPFRDFPGERMYRTGDWARFLPDSRIQYFGRIDHQVKIRGFRIELGEIESVLLSHPAVSEAVVQAREGEKGRKRLVAYAETARGSATPLELRMYVKSKLPDFMVPSAIVTLDKFPLNPNGKLNRLALPEPDPSWLRAEHPYEEPRDELERKLALRWQELLELDRVGIHDNYFDLGGDSLLGEQLAALLEEDGIRIASRDLFGSQTIAELAAWIRLKELAV